MVIRYIKMTELRSKCFAIIQHHIFGGPLFQGHTVEVVISAQNHGLIWPVLIFNLPKDIITNFFTPQI